MIFWLVDHVVIRGEDSCNCPSDEASQLGPCLVQGLVSWFLPFLLANLNLHAGWDTQALKARACINDVVRNLAVWKLDPQLYPHKRQ